MEHLKSDTIILKGGDNEFQINTEYVMLSDRKIGSGSFGNIYICVHIKTKQMYAIKIEVNNGKPSQIFQESKMIQELRSEKGFPSVYHTGAIGLEKYMIMDLLGDNLDNIMCRTKKKKFSMKTSLLITDQLIGRLQFLHNKGIIHRDLKPENILLGGFGNEKILNIIDFGLAKHLFKPKTYEHIPYQDNKEILGTIRYVSINTHKGIEQSRRDDLESLGYILIYFIKGELPWQGIRTKCQKEKIEKIYQRKVETVPNELCKYLPNEIRLYFDHILNLHFTSVPNYFLIHSYIKNLMTKYGFYNDLVFDWDNKEMMLEQTTNVNDNIQYNFNKSTSCDSFSQEKKKITPELMKKRQINKIEKQQNIIQYKMKVFSTKQIPKISYFNTKIKRKDTK